MQLLKRVLRVALFLALAVLVAAAGVAWWAIYRPMPQTGGVLRVRGLASEARVQRDSLGIPHVTAQSLDDLYFVQGYVTAQDRLWQMDMLRRLSGGTLAEVTGPGGYATDADSRMLGMRRIAVAAARNLPPDQRRFFEDYAAGVNACIAATARNLPLEFRVMRYSPQPWTVEDSLLVALQMYHQLTTTWRDQLFKLLLTTRMGSERAAELLPAQTARDHPPAEEARDRGGHRFAANFVARRALSSPTDAGSSTLARFFAVPPGSFDAINTQAVPGSNNWVVSGAHTASGKPMMANDPHLPFSVPGVWYSIQLRAPGLNAAGVSLPGLPAVILGHNERIAWSATSLGANVQDMYIEELNPANRKLYRVDGEWKPVETRTESISIRGEQPRQITFTLTRHGPIALTEDGKSYAIRWMAAEPIPWSFPFLGLQTAQNWEDFRSALSAFPGPGQNFVYADVDGNIGYQAAGRLPIRPLGDGSMPIDGSSTANDWKGYVPFDAMPRVYNPPSGFVATANARVFPDNYPYPISGKWASPDRTERIYQLLKAGGKFQPEDFLRMQTDVYSRHYKLLATAFGEALQRRRAHDPSSMRLARQLLDWSGEITAQSAEVSVTQFARFQVVKALLQPKLGAAYVWYRWPMSSIFLERLVTERPPAWLPAGTPDYDELLAHCVDEGVALLRERFHTNDSAQWPWGQLTMEVLAHPLGGRFPSFLRFGFGVPPFSENGNGYTVNQVSRGFGPSMRMVVDLGNMDASVLTLQMGESGAPFNGHFKDQFEAWKKGSGLPFPFTDAAVGRATKEALRLVPTN